MRFVLKEGQKVFVPNQRTNLLSIFNMILMGNSEDARAALTMESGFESHQKELAELFHLATFWALSSLIIDSTDSSFPDLAYDFRRSCVELEKIWRGKFSLARNRPRCMENLVFVRSELATIIYDQIFLVFSQEFAEQLLELTLQVRDFEDFYRRDSRLMFLMPLMEKVGAFTGFYFEDSENMIRQRSVNACADMDLGSTRPGQEVGNINNLSLETIFAQNCRLFIENIRSGRVNQFLDSIRHQKASRLDLNDQISFLIFEMLTLRLNAEQEKASLLASRIKQIYKKEMSRNDYQSALIQVVSPTLMKTVQTVDYITRISNIAQIDIEPLKTLRGGRRPNSERYKRNGKSAGDILEEIRDSDLHPKFQTILSVQIYLLSGDYFKISSIYNKLQQKGRFEFWDGVLARKMTRLGLASLVNSEVLLFQQTLDRSSIYAIIAHLRLKGEYNRLLYLLSFLTNNPASISLLHLNEFLKKIKSPSRSNYNHSPSSLDNNTKTKKHQRSIEHLRVKDLFSVSEFSSFKLMAVRTLSKLGRSNEAIDLCFESASDPSLASVFTLDLTHLLLSQKKFVEAMQIFELENYFIILKEKHRHSGDFDGIGAGEGEGRYWSSEETFKRKDLDSGQRKYVLTELQMIWRSLKGLCEKICSENNSNTRKNKRVSRESNNNGQTPDLNERLSEIQKLQKMNIFQKIESLEEPKNSLSGLSPEDISDILFKPEFEVLSGHILYLSQQNLNEASVSNPIERRVQKQIHLLFGYMFCPRSGQKNRNKFRQFEEMVGGRDEDLDVKDFLACYEAGNINQRFGQLGSFWGFYNRKIQRIFEIYVGVQSLFGDVSISDDFQILRRALAGRQRARSRDRSGINPLANQVFKPSLTPNLTSNLGLPLIFPPLRLEASKGCKPGKSQNSVISEISNTRFRSQLLNFKIFDVSGLYNRVKLEDARHRGDLGSLKNLSKQMLKEKVTVPPTWAMLDCLLVKKNFQSSAQGFFKMMRKQAKLKRPMTMLLAVGICLLRGGNLAEFLKLLNAAHSTEKVLAIGAIVTASNQSTGDNGKSTRKKSFKKAESLFIGSKENLKNGNTGISESKEHMGFDREYLFRLDQGSLEVRSRSKSEETSFFQLFDKYITKRKIRNPQVAFLLGVYFFYLKRLDYAAKCFMLSQQGTLLAARSWLYLLDISLHSTGHNLYSNHFHKEKFIDLSHFEVKNVKFASTKLRDSMAVSPLKTVVPLISQFVDIYVSPQGNLHIYQNHSIFHTNIEIIYSIFNIYI